jgi:bacillolysin/neutral peptidase B
MAGGLKRLRVRGRDIPSLDKGLADSLQPVAEETLDETARRYVADLFGAPAIPAMSLTADAASGPPELALLDERIEPLTDTYQVGYQQRFHDLPVIGARLGVELRRDRSLAGIDASLAELTEIEALDTTPKISPADIQAKLRALVGGALEGDELPAPTLAIRFDEVRQRWALAYVLDGVLLRARPAELEAEREALALQPYRFFLNAHTGDEIVRVPLFRHLGLIDAVGTDLSGRKHALRANEVGPNEIQLHDPVNKIRTCSLGFARYDSLPSALPGKTITSSSSTFDHHGAVAAHAHATIVHRFFQEIFKRDSIDGKGMEIVSIVDSMSRSGEAPGVWRNAAWFRYAHPQLPAEVHRGIMLYGQIRRADGQLISIAEGLDVVAHELTHGITDYTANLEYITESGALNESMSDIFGAIIVNQGRPIDQWVWTFGGILNAGGQSLRDLRSPSSRGQPEHMNQRRRLAPGEQPNGSNDHGHVHANSGIHNKAAYVLLSSEAFTWEEVARLFYLTLTTPGRLNPLSTFADSRDGMLASCESLFVDAAPEALDAKLEAIRRAFAAVGL